MAKCVVLNAQESTQAETDMVALSASQASLRTFDTAELFDATLVVLDDEGMLAQAKAVEFAERKVTGGPVLNVAVWSDNLEDLDV